VRKPKSHGLAPRFLALGVACLISAACTTATGTGAPPSSPSSPTTGPTSPSSLTATLPPSPTPGPSASKAAGCLVGAAWNNYAEEAISEWYEPALQKPLLASGGTFESVDARSSSDTQRSQIDQFVAEGAKVIIVRVQGDATSSVAPATLRAIERAADDGVQVIAYGYFVDSAKVLWVSFDDVEIGRMEARAILAARPKGNYVIIKGHPQGQLEPDLIASGIHEVLQPAIDKGDIKIVAETYTVNWDPYTAQTELEQILVKNKNIDAVIAESDGMASGAIAALKEVGLDGKVAVAGQGGDTWSLNNVAKGTQTVDVWPDPRLLGAAAGDAAVALCKDPDIAKLKGATLFTSPSHNQIPSILLAPQAITKDNLDVVIDAGFATTKDYVCANVDPSTAPPACR
jgi:D-xylose transport system substrate-binding protein